jgi:hypothetical protein
MYVYFYFLGINQRYLYDMYVKMYCTFSQCVYRSVRFVRFVRFVTSAAAFVAENIMIGIFNV